MMNGNIDSEDLLPKREMDSSEGTAQALLWAMSNLLRWDAPAPKAGKYVFRSQAELATVWASHDGAPEQMPTIDFANDMVIALFVDAGSYKTAPSIGSIRKEGSVILVSCKMFSRPWIMINPASVIKLPRVDGEVVFEECQ